MANESNPIRDPLHNFIPFGKLEQSVIDSRPVQRLRHIHQLALSAQVYPGASHKRFEHSLGVMHLADRIFEVVTARQNLEAEVSDVVPVETELGYWRGVLRVAALCHDIGHLPFSHAAEKELLPEGWDHETLTRELVLATDLGEVFEAHRPQVVAEDVIKLALGPRKVERLGMGTKFDPWQAILAEIIVSDSFGADRMDYLLRDSLHTGVAYGRFDHQRLIQTMRILPGVAVPDEGADESAEPTLGVKRGGLEAAEGMALARYMMFAQVYFHHTRLIYDVHLKDFLVKWLPDGRYPTDVEGHLALTDNEVWAAILDAARDPAKPGHDPARRITTREHFRPVASRRAEEDPASVRAIAAALEEEFGADVVRYGESPRRGAPHDFPVLERDGGIASSLSISQVLGHLPVSREEYVYMPRERRADAERWLSRERERIVEEALAREIENEEES